MKSYFCRVLILIALVVPLSGCPIPVLALGVWSIALGFKGTDEELQVAIQILENGQTKDPDPLPAGADTTFKGTVTWMQDGRDVLLIEDFMTHTVNYFGTVQSSGQMSGDWVDNSNQDTGSWSAVLVE